MFVSTAQQTESATHTHTPLLDFLHFQITTEHWVDFPGLYSRFSLVIHFTHNINSICVSIPISQFLLACPFPLGVHRFVLYINVSISVLQVRSIYFSRFHIYIYIYALIYEICFSLFDFTLYDSSMSKRNKQHYQKMGRRAHLLFKRAV